jgi:hypothetical protein
MLARNRPNLFDDVRSISFPMKRIAGPVLLLVVILLIGGCVQEQAPPSPPGTTGVQAPSPSPTAAYVTQSPVMSPNESLGGPIQFVPGGEYHVGDRILMTGTTILSPGNQLLIEVTGLAFAPTNKTEDNQFSGASAIVTVERGRENSQNTWEYILDTTGFTPGDYQVLITGIQVTGFQKSAYFTLLL